MRRNYISPEFLYTKVNGANNMLEQSSFFGSKMIKISDTISILKEDIIYYQLSTHEQINLLSENTLTPIIYNATTEKIKNHSIIVDPSQSQTYLDGSTKWIMTINIKQILSEHLFAILKRYRTFEGVKNETTIFNDVNAAMNDYITKNILNRYKYANIDMFVSYIDIKLDSTLRFNPTFDSIIEADTNLVKKINSSVDINSETLTINFTQEKDSNLFSFKYYFNLFFDKI